MEHNVDKTLGLLSIARKAGKLQTGEDSVGAMLAEHRARLVLLAADAGPSITRRVRTQIEGTSQRAITLAYDKQTLGAALGRPSVAVAAFTDVSLALAFAKTLPEPDAALMADLEQRVRRVKDRAENGRHTKTRNS